MGKWICDLYNNGDAGWFHVVPLDSDEAAPLLSQYKFGKFRHGDKFKSIFPYNNSWWSIVEAENVCDAIVIFSDIYRKEVWSKAFINKEKADCSNCKYFYTYNNEPACKKTSFENYIYNPDGHYCNKYERKDD